MTRPGPPELDAQLCSAVAELGRTHGLGSVRFRYAQGSCPVFAVGDDHVVKLFAPSGRAHFDTEVAVLRHLEGVLSVATPALRATGELPDEGWLYIAMARLPGEPLREAWPRIPAMQRVQLAVALGRALAELHAVPTAPLAAVAGDFEAFLAEQRRTCVERQARCGLEERWLAQIPDFLASVALGSPAPVLLHTEIMREHVLVCEHGGAFRLSGLIDFEPAMLGHPEYELASVGLFVSEGDAEILGAVLRGYGMPADALGPHLSQRCMAYALLHRYSKLTWYLDRMPPRAGVTTLQDLARQWWPLATAQ